jgi:hypothetical protein
MLPAFFSFAKRREKKFLLFRNLGKSFTFDISTIKPKIVLFELAREGEQKKRLQIDDLFEKAFQKLKSIRSKN